MGREARDGDWCRARGREQVIPVSYRHNLLVIFKCNQTSKIKKIDKYFIPCEKNVLNP